MVQIIVDRNIRFYKEECAYPGVKRVAENVKTDIELIVGSRPKDITGTECAVNCVICGTIGNSDVIQRLEQTGKIDVSSVRGKREVYLFQIVSNPTPEIECAIVIAGSDKRGTIYGLYHLSELLGVSPLVNWNHVWPEKREQVVLSDGCNMISKEPSVKYRGFFINDEWPAFGNWATEHFGGINAKCYETIFELLLRLKGNYLWPAMWNSNFNLDGPGLASAELADELGIVMSTSHHEPCMRAGAEYGMFRGKDSKYGDAWSFITNPEGITEFWRDGLLRNRSFENVITMGMRGENDTAILGEDCTLKDNIDLLRNVLWVQNQLIRETISEDLSKVPRQIVLFTEVEEFFYGNAETLGLIGDTELDGVTLMLSDNNQGSTRTLPSETMRNHPGGYGMYYHMDMHGGPHAFEWIGSTYLPKLWEQMTAAYEYGVQEIWVTNVGDVGTQEYGLSFFLDLAYDIEKWGGTDAAITKQYTKEWIFKQFGGVFTQGQLEELENVLWEYNRLLARRKHETMNDNVYHPVHFGEAGEVLETSEEILRICEKYKQICPKELLGAYISLIYYPACGTANLMRMWILAGRNKFYASQNRLEANDLADKVAECLAFDNQLVDEYHAINAGWFYGFGLSEHIGFTTWNCENNKYPQCIYVSPINQSRMILARTESESYMTGGFWSDKPQVWREALRPDVDRIDFEIACGSKTPISYEIETKCPWLHFSSVNGHVEKTEKIELFIDKQKLKGKEKGSFTVTNVGYGTATVFVEAESGNESVLPNVFLETDGYVAMDASHFCDKHDVEKGGFYVLSPYGRTGEAIKVFPVTTDFYSEKDRPWVAYDFCLQQEGVYNIRFYLAATTPVTFEPKQYIGFSVNDDGIQILNTVKEENKPFFLSAQWRQEAYEHIKITEGIIQCKAGVNRLYVYGMSPAIVVERILLWREDVKVPESYLGPRESFKSVQ